MLKQGKSPTFQNLFNFHSYVVFTKNSPKQYSVEKNSLWKHNYYHLRVTTLSNSNEPLFKSACLPTLTIKGRKAGSFELVPTLQTFNFEQMDHTYGNLCGKDINNRKLGGKENRWTQKKICNSVYDKWMWERSKRLFVGEEKVI